MSSLGYDYDEIRREADARRLGAALYREAESVSPEAVEYVAATLTKLASRSNSPMAVAVADEYANEMAGVAEGAYERTVWM